MRRILHVTLGIIALILPVSAASAQFYVGFGGGDATYDDATVDWPLLLEDEGLFGIRQAPRFEKADGGSKLVLGYRVHRHLAFEGSFDDLGQVSLAQSRLTFCETGCDDGSGATGVRALNTTEIDGVALAVVGILPVKIKKLEIDLFAKAGVYSWAADSIASQEQTTFNVDGAFEASAVVGTRLEESGREEGTSLTYGLGFDAKLYRSLALRVEVEQFDGVGGGSRASDLATSENQLLDGPLTLGLQTDFTTLSASVLYRF